MCKSLCARPRAWRSALSLGSLSPDVISTDTLFFCVRVDNWFQFLQQTVLPAKNKNMPAELKHEDLGISDGDLQY